MQASEFQLRDRCCNPRLGCLLLRSRPFRPLFGTNTGKLSFLDLPPGVGSCHQILLLRRSYRGGRIHSHLLPQPRQFLLLCLTMLLLHPPFLSRHLLMIRKMPLQVGNPRIGHLLDARDFPGGVSLDSGDIVLELLHPLLLCVSVLTHAQICCPLELLHPDVLLTHRLAKFVLGLAVPVRVLLALLVSHCSHFGNELLISRLLSKDVFLDGSHLGCRISLRCSGTILGAADCRLIPRDLQSRSGLQVLHGLVQSLDPICTSYLRLPCLLHEIRPIPVDLSPDSD
mmetsp:Transcript_51256/g.134985  ORF Transcript_51256/g.134985 Transcript_51256/m.134985 type:complete len:284 (-) Transcript_51256:880-1731(-)